MENTTVEMTTMEGTLSLQSEWYPLSHLLSSVSYKQHLFMAYTMIAILVVSLIGNSIVVLIFLGSKKMYSPSNLLLVNLAVADLLMSCCGYPLLIISSFYGRWVFSENVCIFYGATATIFGLMSINTLVFISFDRYAVIVSPNTYSEIKQRHMALSILVIWVYSFLWGLMPLMGWNRYVLEGYGTTCSIDFFTRKLPDRYFLLCLLFADFIFPCCVILVCYTLIFKKVKEHTASMRNLDQDNRYSHGKARWSLELKIARTCVLVFALYCLAWSPYAVVTMISQYGDVSLITPTVSMLPAVFAKMSTTYNPIIYSISHPRFREHLLGICKNLGLCNDSPLAKRSFGTQSTKSGSNHAQAEL